MLPRRSYRLGNSLVIMVGTNVVRVVLVTYLPLLPPDLVCQVVRNEVGDITRGTHAPHFFFF